ncbi:MAG: hypothetical protein MH204_10105, partial [Fimbriimonadaceae bacterium]|nr:hypothetical protein [Fimbriimonadaceae bacterium]
MMRVSLFVAGMILCLAGCSGDSKSPAEEAGQDKGSAENPAGPDPAKERDLFARPKLPADPEKLTPDQMPKRPDVPKEYFEVRPKGAGGWTPAAAVSVPSGFQAPPAAESQAVRLGRLMDESAAKPMPRWALVRQVTERPDGTLTGTMELRTQDKDTFRLEYTRPETRSDIHLVVGQGGRIGGLTEKGWQNLTRSSSPLTAKEAGEWPRQHAALISTAFWSGRPVWRSLMR